MIQRRDDQLTDAEGAGAQDVPICGRHQLQTGRRRHLDHRQVVLGDVAVGGTYGAPQRITDLDRDAVAAERVDDGIDGAFAAVGHRHPEAFCIGQH